EEEHDNLRSALESSLVMAGCTAGLRFCGALQGFWWTRGHFSEGRQWCDRLLGKAGAEDAMPERAKALNTAGGLAYYQGDFPGALALYEESLAISRELGDRRLTAYALNNLGNVVYDQGDLAAARARHEESLAIRRELGDRRGMATTLNNLGNVAYTQGDFLSARELL